MMQNNGNGNGNGNNSNDGASLDGVSVAACSQASEFGNLRWQMAPMTEEDLQNKKHFLALKDILVIRDLVPWLKLVLVPTEKGK